MKSHAKRISHFKESIFATMSKKANEVGAINLSQGFPDFDGPDWLKDLAKNAVGKGHNQYAPFQGVASLRSSLSKVYKKNYELNYCENNEITITNGATEAIFISILATVDPGDEVIVFEPFYDSYISTIEMVGAKAIPITLKAPHFSFDLEELKSAFSNKTKMIIVNNPHNPSGKVFTYEELSEIGKLANEFDSYILSDEVYEYLTYDGIKHIPMATIKNCKDRVITISSVGKTFGVTGWKIGWICSSSEISKSVRLVHQYNTFSVCTPLQYACAEALNRLDDYIPEFRKLYQRKRDYFIDRLKKAGFEPIMPNGSYFIMCPIEQFTKKSDIDFCLELIETKKVATIPPSSFYLKSDDGKKYLRFCFAKDDNTLEKAAKNLMDK